MKQNRPTEIRLLTASRALELIWDDGTHSQYAFSLLRQECRCTECKSAMLRGEQKVPDPAVAVTNILPVGNYAIQLVFDDGHDRGIYPFAYLHELISQDEVK